MININDKEFDQISKIMYELTGVLLKPAKKVLVIGRLRTRLEELKLASFTDYLAFLHNPINKEIEFLVNALTTNETFFYRHHEHFEQLNNKIWPDIVVKRGESRKTIQVVSFPCSSGEEPYTIAILACEFMIRHPGWKIQITAADINTKVLDEARKGIYLDRRLNQMPKDWLAKYFVLIEEGMFGVKKYQLNESIRKMVSFRQHNLLKPFPLSGVDVFFMRNVLIYFDTASKAKVVQQVERCIATGGYLIISMAETLGDIKCGLELVTASMYRKPEIK